MGYYEVMNQKIGISTDIPLLMQIFCLLHELAHCYEVQILNKPYKFYKKGKIHNSAFRKVVDKFLKETDKIVKIGLK